MTLANTTWDDSFASGTSWRPARPRPSLVRTLITGAIVISGGIAGLAAMHSPQMAKPGLDVAGPSALEQSLARVAAERRALLSLAPPSPLQRNAESFLHDSLPLTQPCGSGCGAGAEIEEAQKLAALPTGTAPADASGRMAGLAALRQSFSVPLAAPTVPTPVSAVVGADGGPLAPVAVHVEPSVVVPLPPLMQNAAAPLPAPRLTRAAGDAAVLADPGEPVADAPAAAAPTPSSASLAALGGNSGTAIYDISAATVYLPDGERLEAHSGMGYMVDNPRYVDRRNTGPTPPNTYNLIMREQLFHGVAALRLIPANGDNRYGRVGLLAHTYLLRGRPAESNGCVAFKDYARFLNAFERGQIKRLVVVPSLSRAPIRVASAGLL